MRCLLRDDVGRLWIGTRGGLCVIDPTASALEAIPLYGDLPRPHRLATYRIDLDAQGLPMVSTNDGLFVPDGSGRFIGTAPRCSKGNRRRLTGCFRTPLGTFLGTEYGLYRYDLATHGRRPISDRPTPPRRAYSYSRLCRCGASMRIR